MVEELVPRFDLYGHLIEAFMTHADEEQQDGVSMLMYYDCSHAVGSGSTLQILRQILVSSNRGLEIS